MICCSREKQEARPVVLTDLDGTLLDHQTYGFSAASEALDFLQVHEIPGVFEPDACRDGISPGRPAAPTSFHQREWRRPFSAQRVFVVHTRRSAEFRGLRGN